MKEIRAKRLNEDHDIEEYKGYELDFNTDTFNKEDEVVEIRIDILKNGKKVHQEKGLRNARKWVDNKIEQERKSFDIKFIDDDTWHDFDGEEDGILGVWSDINFETNNKEIDKKLKDDAKGYDIFCQVYEWNHDDDTINRMVRLMGVGTDPEIYIPKQKSVEWFTSLTDENPKLTEKGKREIKEILKDIILEYVYGEKLNESLLTEDHKVEKYKGYELDFNTDLLDTEEESVVINVRVIDKNGKVLTTQRGFRKAREFVDKLVAEEEKRKAEEEKRLQNFNVEVELGNIDKYSEDELLEFANVNIDNEKIKRAVGNYIAEDNSLDEEPWIGLDLVFSEYKRDNKYGGMITFGVYFDGDRIDTKKHQEAVYEYDNKEESEFIEDFDSDEPKWKPGAKEKIEKLVKDFIKKEILKAPIVKEEKMEENLYIHTDKNDKRLGIYDTQEEAEEKWKDGDYILDVENQTLYKKEERVEESKKLNEGAGAGYNAEGELYEIKIDKILDIKTEVEENDPVSIATIKVEGTGKFDGAVYDYYGYGARLEESEVKIKELSVNINIFEYTPNEEEDYQNITVEDLNNLFYGRVIKIRSKIIGWGWTHVEFTGKDISLRGLDESSYSLNDIVFDFVNEEDIKEVEYGLTHHEDEYEDDLEECFARELDEELTNKDIVEIEKELEDILKEHPEGHSIEVKTEEEKEYAKNRLKEKGYEVEVSGNDLADRYHIEYYKKELKEDTEETKELPKLTKEEAEDIAKEEYLFGTHEAVEKLEEKGFDCKEFFDRVERISEDEIPAIVVEEAKEELYKKLGIEDIMVEARDTVWDRADDDEFLFM